MYATPTAEELMQDFSNMQPRDSRGRLPGDETLLVKFYKRAVLSELKSEEAQRPIYDDLDHILIIVPGDDKTKIDTVVTSEHKQRFPLEWKRYIEEGVVAETGTPLEQWAALSPGQIAEFKHFNIRTVEALAALSDDLARKFMGGGHSIREKAKQYLKAAADVAIVERQEAELAKRDNEIAELRKMVEELAAKGKKNAN